ncbi:hypothetical protein BCV69DRAFT_73482 [Microstroma glucosiphilum]|uniref:Uncharacterized protein n=1 Tax=Pseudomicrostroma glucosiphilum TaxID=1684307 RepID=A0A316TYV8_9BASI|nr:hypothetical protein BCV69DRAFT_73482 [Pseudomicrostroma glucosiphilum]PWN18436.1 hypothetical protein BCV69DRAFT_73482 [Pseudomicrostroma glucosiphilum]
MIRPISLSRRTLTSSIFFATFFGSVLTVAASTLLPCPARRGGYKLKRKAGEADKGGFTAIMAYAINTTLESLKGAVHIPGV